MNIRFLTLGMITVMVSIASAFSFSAQDTPAPSNTLQSLYQLRVDAAQDAAQNGDVWTFERHNSAAGLYFALGDDLQAAAHLESSIALNSNQPEILQQLAAFYIDTQQWTKAYDTLQAQLTLSPEDKTALIELGLLRAIYDKDTAISTLQQITFGPEVMTTVLNFLNATSEPIPDLVELGLILGRYERWDLAELAFREAARISATPRIPWRISIPEIFAYVGLARANQGKSAEHWFTSALTDEPENPQIWYIVGTYYRQQRQFDESINSFIYGYSFDQQNAFFPLQIAEVYEDLRNLTMAEVWFNEARTRSNDAQIIDRVNRFYAENAAMLAAVESIERLPRVATDLTPEIRASLGWLFYTSGSEETGLEEINRALAQKPDSPEALYYKANILIDQDNLAEARPLLEQVAAGESNFSDNAQELVERLFP